MNTFGGIIIDTKKKWEDPRKLEKVALDVSINNMISNTVLSAVKLFAGIVGHSQAIISDAIHSVADVFDTVIVIIGVKLSTKAADEGHPYGHERFECVAAVILSGILGAVGISIGIGGLMKIITGQYEGIVVPGVLAVVVAIVSIVVKEAMYWYTQVNAKRIDSSALRADAWHHRLDALCSAGGLVGVVGARAGFPICDPLASVLICVFIIKAAVGIFIEAIRKMVDHSCDPYMESDIRTTILGIEGVMDIAELRTRLFGMKVYVEVIILADETMKLLDAHQIAQAVKYAVETNNSRVKHCAVYMEPLLKK